MVYFYIYLHKKIFKAPYSFLYQNILQNIPNPRSNIAADITGSPQCQPPWPDISLQVWLWVLCS